MLGTRFRLIIVMGLLCPSGAVAQFDEIGQFVPARSNAIAFVNIEKILASEYAVQHGWVEDARIQFPVCPLHAPADTRRAILAAEFDVTGMKTLWEASLFEMKHPVKLAGFEVYAGRQADRILELQAVETRDRSYLVKLSDTVMANVFPASRQFVARYLSRSGLRGSNTLSPYLQEAFSYVSHDNDPAEMILAVDLSNVLDTQQIREHPILKNHLSKHEVDPYQLARTLASLRGLMLGVRIGEKPIGRLKLDFGVDAGLLADNGKELVLDVLRSLGMMIDEFEDWTPHVEGKQFYMEGDLGDVAIRQIASVIDPPSLYALRESGGTDRSSGASAEALATKEHYRRVDDLVTQLRTRRTQSLGATAFFYERYARKIDRLPILDVDTEMLDYSAHVANLLRQVAATERGVAVSSAAVGKQVAASSAYSGGGYGYGGYNSGYYGYYLPRSYSSFRRAGSAAAVAQGAKEKHELLGRIDQAAAEIRRQMTEKYRIEF